MPPQNLPKPLPTESYASGAPIGIPDARGRGFPTHFLPFRHPSAFFAPAFCARLSLDFLSAVNADSGSLIQ
jgi:hypothetical protein